MNGLTVQDGQCAIPSCADRVAPAGGIRGALSPATALSQHWGLGLSFKILLGSRFLGTRPIFPRVFLRLTMSICAVQDGCGLLH